MRIKNLFHNFIKYRALIAKLVVRDLEEKYRGSIFRNMWSLINPIVMILLFTLIFSKIMQIRISGLQGTESYVLYLCTGLLPWMAFEETIRQSTGIFLAHASTLKNSPVPPEIFVFTPCLSSSITLAINLVIILVFSVCLGHSPGFLIILLPFLIILQQIFALGISLLTAALNVYFRDISQITHIFLMFGFWLTPIVYFPSILPDWSYSIINLNPLTHLVFLYRAVVLGNMLTLTHGSYYFLAFVLIFSGISVFIFHKLKLNLVDEI